MAERLLAQAARAALKAWRMKQAEFLFCGQCFKIQHAHHNEYQVMLPNGGGEILRIIADAEVRIMAI